MKGSQTIYEADDQRRCLNYENLQKSNMKNKSSDLEGMQSKLQEKMEKNMQNTMQRIRKEIRNKDINMKISNRRYQLKETPQDED